MHRYLCAYYGRETVYDEFKVFCISANTWQHFFENEDIYAIFHDQAYLIDKFRFDQMINIELEHYFERYFSKYIASFVSSGIKGTIHIGLSDAGIIEGIPYFGDISSIGFETFIKKCFMNTLRIKMSSEDINCDIIMQQISININALEQNELLTDINNSALKRLESHLVIKNDCKRKWEEYREKYKEWYDELSIYNVKLKKLINIPEVQKHIAKYIRSKRENYDCDLSTVIRFYESKPIVEYDITMQMVLDVANDYQSPIYWLINYKDHKIDEIQKQKPIAPVQHQSDFNYVNYAQHVMNIRPYLLTQKCNFYTITIIVNQIDNCVMEYMNVKREWQIKKRVLQNESVGPITRNYYE